MKIVGLDLGGANLKAATAEGVCCSIPFPMWRQPEKLADALTWILAELPAADVLAVTMTGELADCFATKEEGVRRILASVQGASKGREVLVWTTEGRFVGVEEACAEWLKTAAANWHALASWCGREFEIERGLMFDLGSTTTDLIPILQQSPAAVGKTDFSRMRGGELVYLGVARTPVCAIAKSVSLRGENCPLAAELFSTSGDVFLLTGDVSEDVGNLETANGKPATLGNAHDRLARQFCCDRSEISLAEARELATVLKRQMMEQVGEALQRVLSRFPGECETVFVSGSGSFLARQILASEPALQNSQVHLLEERMTPEVSTAACAYAVSRLVQSR